MKTTVNVNDIKISKIMNEAVAVTLNAFGEAVKQVC